MSLDFTAVDFETANSSNASACAVGLARVRGGVVVETEGWLIRPPFPHDRFFEINTRIHGIRAEDVADAPSWDYQLPALRAFLGEDIVLAHNAGFDMSVIKRASEAAGSDCPSLSYACSVQIARRTYDLPSYRLPAAAAAAGFEGFSHHDAVADALACAHIVIDAARRAGVDSVPALTTSLGVRLAELEGFSAPAETVFA
ncbi:3'-5' exonuclease [Microbacterium sediminicola]|uniref:3'-5' exonuclease n=1 Tax=Microbacterium sediminicola TaxID=415210 RepID=A0ABN2I1J4_9MICO